jgi:hypothetical protein
MNASGNLDFSFSTVSDEQSGADRVEEIERELRDFASMKERLKMLVTKGEFTAETIRLRSHVESQMPRIRELLHEIQELRALSCNP